MPASARKSRTPTRAASENSTHTSVVSARSLTISGSRSPDGRANDSRNPSATNAMGAVTSARCSRADSTPQPNTAAAMTAITPDVTPHCTAAAVRDGSSQVDEGPHGARTPPARRPHGARGAAQGPSRSPPHSPPGAPEPPDGPSHPPRMARPAPAAGEHALVGAVGAPITKRASTGSAGAMEGGRAMRLLLLIASLLLLVALAAQ